MERVVLLYYIESWFRNKKGFCGQVYRDVPYCNGYVDLMLVDEDGSVTAVCADMARWQTAYQRARDASLAADRCFACVSVDNFPSVQKSTIAGNSVGLLQVNPRTGYVRQTIQPPPPVCVSASYRNSLMRGLVAQHA